MHVTRRLCYLLSRTANLRGEANDDHDALRDVPAIQRRPLPFERRRTHLQVGRGSDRLADPVDLNCMYGDTPHFFTKKTEFKYPRSYTQSSFDRSNWAGDLNTRKGGGAGLTSPRKEDVSTTDKALRSSLTTRFVRTKKRLSEHDNRLATTTTPHRNAATNASKRHDNNGFLPPQSQPALHGDP